MILTVVYRGETVHIGAANAERKDGGMRIRQVVIDTNDPWPLTEFWALATGRSVGGDADPYVNLEDPEGRDVTLLLPAC